MAGVTDRPFRQLCKQFGAGLAVSEMISAKPETWSSDKSRARINHEGEVEPRSVQIVGADPGIWLRPRRYNVENGAQIIDINMGCPAKKICNVMAGSALLRDEALVASLLDAWSRQWTCRSRSRSAPAGTANRNGVAIARMAEKRHPGVGDARAHARRGFSGEAEYDTIAAVKAR